MDSATSTPLPAGNTSQDHQVNMRESTTTEPNKDAVLNVLMPQIDADPKVLIELTQYLDTCRSSMSLWRDEDNLKSYEGELKDDEMFDIRRAAAFGHAHEDLTVEYTAKIASWCEKEIDWTSKAGRPNPAEAREQWCWSTLIAVVQQFIAEKLKRDHMESEDVRVFFENQGAHWSRQNPQISEEELVESLLGTITVL